MTRFYRPSKNSFDKFSCVRERNPTNPTIYIILSDKLCVPGFDDHIASDASFIPMDFTNPDSWDWEYDAYLCYNTDDGKTEVMQAENLESFNPQECGSGYVPFDLGTSQLRRVLGLISLAGSGYTDLLTKHNIPTPE